MSICFKLCGFPSCNSIYCSKKANEIMSLLFLSFFFSFYKNREAGAQISPLLKPNETPDQIHPAQPNGKYVSHTEFKSAAASEKVAFTASTSPTNCRLVLLVSLFVFYGRHSQVQYLHIERGSEPSCCWRKSLRRPRCLKWQMIKRAVTGVKATFVMLDGHRPCFSLLHRRRNALLTCLPPLRTREAIFCNLKDKTELSINFMFAISLSQW